MPWPTPQDYNEAVQNPLTAFADRELRTGLPELNQLGLPRPISGGFACVYKIRSGASNWAARCFLTEVTDQQDRYHAISTHLASARLPYTVPFTYLPKGIKVMGKWYPLLKMEWIQASSLGAYVERELNNPIALRTLADNWAKMLLALQAAGIAHGDLQHGNVLIDQGQIRLIDYDGMFVPSLGGRKSREVGHRNYQHPRRTESDFGAQLDNFSAWVVWVAIRALSVRPELWSRYRGGDECLLLRKEDFLNPARSAILRDLNDIPNHEIASLADLFINFPKLPPLGVPQIDEAVLRQNLELWERKNQQRILQLKRQREEMEELERQRVLREKKRREELAERERQRILSQRRRRRALLAASCLIGAVSGITAVHLWLLSHTTLSFGVLLDGKPFPSNKTLNVTVDSKPFTTGGRITLGHHEIVAKFPDGEEFSKAIWTFYGSHDLGPLPLESSKGSLSVTAKPSPAMIVLEKDGADILEGTTVLKVSELPVGDYLLLVRRGEYQESRPVRIERRKRTDLVVELDLGTVELSSSPPDAEFELANDNRHWRGKLPIRIEDVPAGTYRFSAQRKSWVITKEVTISRGHVTSQILAFDYGSLSVNSTPVGLNTSIDGTSVGKTPILLTEIRPGEHRLTVSDGDNQVADEITIGPKQLVERSIAFHYGAVRVLSSPPGATVLRNGVEIGRTPLTRSHMTVGEGTLELDLDGYRSATIPVRIEEGQTANYTIKLLNSRYLSAMAEARQALDANQFESAAQLTRSALDIDPGDADATTLLAEVNRRLEQWQQAQMEAKRIADEERARQMAAEFAALPLLRPEEVINSCWNNAKPPDNSVNLGDVARQKGVMAPISVPIWAVTDLIVKGIGAIPGSSPKLPRFDQGVFSSNFQNRVYKFVGQIARVNPVGKTVEFSPGGRSKRSFVVLANLGSDFQSTDPMLSPGTSISVYGQLSQLEEDGQSNNLVLDNAKIYRPGVHPPAPNQPTETIMDSRAPPQEALPLVRRDIREALASDAEIGTLRVESRLFKYDYKDVWRAALSEAKVGPIFDSIGLVDEANGVIYSKVRGDHGYVESDYYTQAHPQYMVLKQYVVLVTDTNAGIDVQVVMKVFTDKTWTDYQGVIRSERKISPGAYVTTGDANAFLDSLQSRLHHSH